MGPKRASFLLQPGEQFAGKYRVENVIGKGGSATVYRAQHLQNGAWVALKVFHVRHVENQVERQRFDREIRLIQQMSSAHVVAMLDHGYTDDGVPYIVFELLQGSSLKEAIARDAPFSPERTARIALQVLDALEGAHTVGIAHRDIKPGNIHLAEGYDKDFVKVLDFGFAKATLKEEGRSTQVTEVGIRVGTPRYMSPEQARAEDVVAASDLYSLALIIAEMITGKPVVDGMSNVVDVLIAHGAPQSLQIPTQVLSSPLGSVVQRALTKSQAVRYQTALQMRVDIEAALARNQRTPGDAGPRPSRSASPDLRPTMVFDSRDIRAQSDAIMAARAASAKRKSIPLAAIVAGLVVLALASAVLGYVLAG